MGSRRGTNSLVAEEEGFVDAGDAVLVDVHAAVIALLVHGHREEMPLRLRAQPHEARQVEQLDQALVT